MPVAGRSTKKKQYDKISVVMHEGRPMAINVLNEFYMPLLCTHGLETWDWAIMLDDRVSAYSTRFDAVYRIPSIDEWRLISENIDEIQELVMRNGGDSLVGKTMWTRDGEDSDSFSQMCVKFTWNGYGPIRTEWLEVPKSDSITVRRIYNLRPNKDIEPTLIYKRNEQHKRNHRKKRSKL